MSSLKTDKPKGLLRDGWSAIVEDYAIAGGWAGRGKILVVGDAVGSIYAFEGSSGKISWKKEKGHGAGLLCLSIHPNGASFVTGGQDGRCLFWNVKDGQEIRSIELGRGWVENVCWSPDGQWLAVSISRSVYMYNAAGEEVWRSENHPSTVSAIAWSGSSELATACYGRVAFFSAASGELTQKLEWKGSLVSMVLSPDGDIVACGSQDNSVHFWRRSTGQDSMMHGYPAKPTALSFDSTGTLLATGGGEAVTVWSFQGSGPEGSEPGVLNFHVLPITNLEFAPHGMRLASGARDGAVILWSLQPDGKGGTVGAALVGDIVSSLLWRPDGRALAALDARGGITVWRVGK